jgi:cytidine deaminase
VSELPSIRKMDEADYSDKSTAPCGVCRKEMSWTCRSEVIRNTTFYLL